MEEGRWFSVEEIAAHLGVTKESVYRWIERQGLPAHRIGKLWKFDRTEVDDWVRRSGRPSRSPGPPPPANPLPDPLLREVLARLVTAYQPLRVYLFGSRARDEASRESDYDLLLVVPDDASAERRRSRLAYRVLRGTGAAVDALVVTRRYFEDRLHLRSSLPAVVSREGKLLYAA